MSLFHQQNINENTKLAIWRIEEEERFFLEKVPLQCEITHPHKRLQHLAGRYLLQYLFPDFPYEEMLIADSRKPYLLDEQYHFSISHCGNYASAIVSACSRVGVDVENITHRMLRIQHKFLNSEELDFVSQYDELLRITLLTVLWSAKEAVYKWWSFGDIDFSEDIRIQPFSFDMEKEGYIKAIFLHKKQVYNLKLVYQLMPGISLVWIETNH